VITAIKLSMRFGSKILFRQASFQLNPGQHYGLVGANGSGKSTLLHLLAKEMVPDAGDIHIPNQCRVETLKQDHYLYEQIPILNVVLMGKQELWQALQAKQRLLDTAHFTVEDCETLEELDKKILQYNGYAAASQAAQLLEGLGLEQKVHSQPLHTLSGGYKLRVLLAQVLFSEPDILLLDEPTNHLDLFSIRWLENYLKAFPGTLLISSHDRDFLNGVCTYIMDLDHETLKIYKGNYDQFLELKAIDWTQKQNLLAKQDKKREELQEFIDRFRAKASKARQAQSKMHLVSKLEGEIEELDLSPSSRKYPRLHFKQSRPSGAIPLKVHNICKAFGDKQVLHNVHFEVAKGERIAFLGANGIGKSTLLGIITHSLTPSQGYVKWGHAAQFAYFPQDHNQEVQGSSNLLDWLRQHNPLIAEQRLRDVLGMVLFSGDDANKPIHVLSGGEKARLILAKMMLMEHNVLIFDEPTNHLDMESIEALLEALTHYPGTLLFVSHNRHFIAPIANRIIELTTDGILDYACSFSEYLAQRDIDLLAAKAPKKIIDKEKTASQLSYELQKQQQKQKSALERKVLKAEERCHALEHQLKALDETLSADGFYQEALKEQIEECLQRKRELENLLSHALKEWEELSHSLYRLLA
jgi:ATPase subunit of ABC transporter with duplicated ATPase domains